MTRLKIALIRTSLPSYFPQRHNVWDGAQAMLERLCSALGVTLFVVPHIPMDGAQTRQALEVCLRENVDFVLCLHGGFTMGDVARTIAASRFRAGFWSVPEPVRTGDIQLNNFVSLNMSLSIAAGVRDLGKRPMTWYHGAAEDPQLQDRISTTLRALSAAKSLEGARIGVIGGLAMSFFNMEVDSSDLARRFGVEVVNHDFDEVVRRVDTIADERAQSEASAMRAAAPVNAVSDAHMILNAKVSMALRDIAREKDHAALAVSDWPQFQERMGIHPGAAFSWLEENDLLPVASEGDVLGAVSQLVAKSLTGRVGALLDMTEPDLATGRLLMWHGGGGPLHLAEPGTASWINHPMLGRGSNDRSGYGAIADYTFTPGPVTVFRLGHKGNSLFEISARIVQCDPSGFSGIRGWLEQFSINGQDASLRDVINTVMCHGVEHHYILVPGEHRASLTEFAAWSDMTALDMRRYTDFLEPKTV